MKYLLVIGLLFTLAGCTPNVKTFTFYSELDPTWLKPCEITPPPPKDLYVAAHPDERAILMAISYTMQLEATSKCNVRLNEIDKHNKRMIEHNVKEQIEYDKLNPTR